MQKTDRSFGELIDSRVFNMDDQLKFATFSADTNPIHVDPVSARRTMAGECIVHGVHGLMYALNALVRHHGLTMNSFETKFSKPIPLDIPVDCYWDSERNKLTIANENTLFTSILVVVGRVSIKGKLSDIKVGDPLILPRNLTLEQCAEIGQQELVYRGDMGVGKVLFPELFKSYGEVIAAEMASTSEIVGMQVPGLNSLFLSINGNISEDISDSFYSLLSCDLRFGITSVPTFD